MLVSTLHAQLRWLGEITSVGLSLVSLLMVQILGFSENFVNKRSTIEYCLDASKANHMPQHLFLDELNFFISSASSLPVLENSIEEEFKSPL